MDTLLTLLNWLLPLLYVALLLDYGATFFLGIRTHVRTPHAAVAVAAHLGLLILRGVHLGYPPLVNNYEILSLVAVSMAGMYWALEGIGRDRRAGLFVFALVFLFQYTSSTFLAGSIATAGADAGRGSPWVRLHVVPAVLAYTALTFAGVYGLLHLIAQRNLKRHRFGLLFDRLPPLELLGRRTWHALLLGFAFTTVSVATGLLLFSHNSDVSQAKVASKILAGSAAWAVCLLAVLGRWIGKWSILQVARIAVTGFAVIMALLIISAALS